MEFLNLPQINFTTGSALPWNIPSLVFTPAADIFHFAAFARYPLMHTTPPMWYINAWMYSTCIFE